MNELTRVLYIVLIGLVFYNMIKRGGCCGGHGHNHGNRGKREEDNIGNLKDTASVDDLRKVEYKEIVYKK